MQVAGDVNDRPDDVGGALRGLAHGPHLAGESTACPADPGPRTACRRCRDLIFGTVLVWSPRSPGADGATDLWPLGLMFPAGCGVFGDATLSVEIAEVLRNAQAVVGHPVALVTSTADRTAARASRSAGSTRWRTNRDDSVVVPLPSLPTRRRPVVSRRAACSAARCPAWWRR